MKVDLVTIICFLPSRIVLPAPLQRAVLTPFLFWPPHAVRLGKRGHSSLTRVPLAQLPACFSSGAMTWPLTPA